MSFVIKVIHQSIEDQIIQSLYRQDAPCTHAIHHIWSLYIFNTIDSHYAKHILGQCNAYDNFHMENVWLIIE